MNNPYQTIFISARPFPIEELFDPANPDIVTLRQQEIRDETRLAYAAPDLAQALRVLLEAAIDNQITVGDCNQARAALDKAGWP